MAVLPVMEIPIQTPIISVAGDQILKPIRQPELQCGAAREEQVARVEAVMLAFLIILEIPAVVHLTITIVQEHLVLEEETAAVISQVVAAAEVVAAGVVLLDQVAEEINSE